MKRKLYTTRKKRRRGSQISETRIYGVRTTRSNQPDFRKIRIIILLKGIIDIIGKNNKSNVQEYQGTWSKYHCNSFCHIHGILEEHPWRRILELCDMQWHDGA
jgi:hypothetical protein